MPGGVSSMRNLPVGLVLHASKAQSGSRQRFSATKDFKADDIWNYYWTPRGLFLSRNSPCKCQILWFGTIAGLSLHIYYVMLLRHQRLLTLRTWCGYRYEMVWKWITTHYFSWNNRNTHYFYLWKYFDIPSKNKRRSRKINLLFKQGMNVSLNKWNSTFIEKEKLLLTSLYCFYTEKKTLNWIPIAVIMFI
jgi:hypothetical protein